MFGLPRGSRLPQHAGFGSLAGHVLVVNPGVGLLQPGSQGRIGFPIEILLDQRVVAVAAVDAFGSAQVVIPLQLDPSDALPRCRPID